MSTCLTVCPLVTWYTWACISIHSIATGTAILTGKAGTLISIYKREHMENASTILSSKIMLHIKVKKKFWDPMSWKRNRVNLKVEKWKYTNIKMKIKLYQISLIIGASFKYRLLPVWQFVPSYPGAHVHVYWFIWSLQVPPYWQGLLAHSFVSRMKEKSCTHQSWLFIAVSFASATS